MPDRKRSIVEKNTMRYCGTGLPRKPVPAGSYLVHNHASPASKLGMNGFRAWIQKGRRDLVVCCCDFGGCNNAELHTHYRIRALAPPVAARAEKSRIRPKVIKR